MHEAQMHPENSFVTLTFDDEHIPANYSVSVRDVQLFNKRLRKSLPQKIRFFACGEYGDLTLRPHYHLLIFNHSFPDRKLHAVRDGNRYYKSDALNALWPYGQLNEVTDVTYKSAAYVARYNLKKVNGDRADDHYTRVSPIDGNVYRVAPEFLIMSRRPGIGSTWFDKFGNDAFPSDFLIFEGRKHKPPKFYLDRLPEGHALVPTREVTQHKIKRARVSHARKHRSDSTRERLAVREAVQQARLSRLKRQL